MIKVLSAGQLTSQPAPVSLPTHFPEGKVGWLHVINLSPYAYEIQDDSGTVRSVVTAFRERVVGLKVRTERVQLVAVATQTPASNVPNSAWALYAEVLDQQPVMEGNLAT